MKLRKGNVRFDPWHGMTQFIVLFARIMRSSTKKVDGTVVNLGEGYKADTGQDLIVRFGTNKLSPSSAMIWRSLGTHEDEYGERVDMWGNKAGLKEEAENLRPIYIQKRF